MKYLPYLIAGLLLTIVIGAMTTQYKGCIDLEMGLQSSKLHIQGACNAQETAKTLSESKSKDP